VEDLLQFAATLVLLSLLPVAGVFDLGAQILGLVPEFLRLFALVRVV